PRMFKTSIAQLTTAYTSCFRNQLAFILVHWRFSLPVGFTDFGFQQVFRSADRRAVTEAKPLINANGRQWKRIKRGCFHSRSPEARKSALFASDSRSFVFIGGSLSPFRINS